MAAGGSVRPAPRCLARPHAVPARRPGRPGESVRLETRRAGSAAASAAAVPGSLPAPAKQAEARPRPSSGAPSRPAYSGRARGGAHEARAPPPGGSERAGEQRRGGSPRLPRAVRPPARRPARGGLEPWSHPRARSIGPPRGCVGGAGRTRGTPREMVQSTPGLPTAPLLRGSSFCGRRTRPPPIPGLQDAFKMQVRLRGGAGVTVGKVGQGFP